MATTKGHNNEHGYIVKRQRGEEPRPSDPSVTPRPFSARSAAEEYQRIYKWMYPKSNPYVELV